MKPLQGSSEQRKGGQVAERQELLTNLAPMLRYNLADDGFGNVRVIVPAGSWAAAYYHVHGVAL